MKVINFDEVSLPEAKRVHDGSSRHPARYDGSSRRSANDVQGEPRPAAVSSKQ